MAPLVVLIGPPGAGKSTVGRLVAETLGAPFRDTDTDVEQTAGMAVADIFVLHGEEEFRRHGQSVGAGRRRRPVRFRRAPRSRGDWQS